jgi:glucokinase
MTPTGQIKTSVLGVEISNTLYRSVILESGELTHFQEIPWSTETDLVRQLINHIREAKELHPDLRKVGIAVPGLYNQQARRVVLSTQIPTLVEINLAQLVSEETGLEVVLENDANAAAFGEYRIGAGRDSGLMFYATVGQGVGGALVFNGNLWRGASGFAGEFGYITINEEGMKLEEVASSSSIIRRVKDRLHQDHTSSLFSKECFTVEDVVKAANSGDDFAQMMLSRTGMFIGIATASVINLLNVDRVVIGGEVMEVGQLILDPIIEHAERFSFEPSFETAKIVSAELGHKAGAIGIALLQEETANSNLTE